MTYEIKAQILAEQATVACRDDVLEASVGPWLAEVYAQLTRYLEHLQVSPAGPPYARFAFHDGRMQVEAGFPVASGVCGEGSVLSASLPRGPVATTTHFGPYDGLQDAYGALRRWLADGGHHQSGPHWEVYYTDPAHEPDISRWRTDVYMPFAIAAERVTAPS